MNWIDALKIFNKDRKWIIPKRGTPEYQMVRDIMNGNIQGSGLFDVFGKLYNMDKTRKDKKAAEKAVRIRKIQDDYRAFKAAEKAADAADAASVVASTPVVGSGFGDFLKFTFDKKNYMKENQARIDKKAAELRARELRAKPFMQKEADVVSTPVGGSRKSGFIKQMIKKKTLDITKVKKPSKNLKKIADEMKPKKIKELNEQPKKIMKKIKLKEQTVWPPIIPSDLISKQTKKQPKQQPKKQPKNIKNNINAVADSWDDMYLGTILYQENRELYENLRDWLVKHVKKGKPIFDNLLIAFFKPYNTEILKKFSIPEYLAGIKNIVDDMLDSNDDIEGINYKYLSPLSQGQVDKLTGLTTRQKIQFQQWAKQQPYTWRKDKILKD